MDPTALLRLVPVKLAVLSLTCKKEGLVTVLSLDMAQLTDDLFCFISFTVIGGSLGEMHAKKIAGVDGYKMGAPLKYQ